ncbi:MAG: HEAT repeat domain-containing protein [Vicinamibacteria bacterium]|nr:HEAT repeat domain-containing protein [Vicinamibacteria bacterium]
MRQITRFLVGFAGALALSCASGGARRGADIPDPLSRMEILARILVLEDSRSLGEGSILGFLQNEDPAVRRRAALAAGRIGDPLASSRLIERLRDREPEVRRAAAFALGLLGGAEAGPALVAALDDPDAATRGRASEALGRIGQHAAGAAIAKAFRKALPPSGGPPLRIRGDDPGRVDDPWVELRLQLVALARLKDAPSLTAALLGSDSTPLVDWWVSVWAAMRVADPRLTPILLAGTGAEDPYIRALAARGLGALKDPAHLAVLRRLADDPNPGVVIQALRGVGAIGAAEGGPIAAAHLDSSNPVLRREALLALAALPSTGRWRSRVMDNVGHPDPWIRSAAWPALVRIDAEDVGIVLSTVGPDSDAGVRRAVAGALAESLGERAAPFLLPMLKDDGRVVPAVLSALVRARGQDAAPTLLDHLQSPDMGIRAAAIEGLSSLEKGAGKTFTDAFARAYEASLADEDIEARIAAVDALGANATEAGRTVLRRIAATDPSRVARQRAMSAVSEGFAPPENGSLRLADARRLAAVYDPGAQSLYSPHVLIGTRHGIIELVLDLVDAPLTSSSFVRLAQSGFFNGLTFHRVVPGFVVQGGDPRGDGYGGMGSTIRCEYNQRPYGRGAVGMALSGKDTGGSQFFITLEPQPHLDGSFTHFGQVLSGMDVVEKIRPGDVIERIDVFDGREVR